MCCSAFIGMPTSLSFSPTNTRLLTTQHITHTFPQKLALSLIYNSSFFTLVFPHSRPNAPISIGLNIRNHSHFLNRSPYSFSPFCPPNSLSLSLPPTQCIFFLIDAFESFSNFLSRNEIRGTFFSHRYRICNFFYLTTKTNDKKTKGSQESFRPVRAVEVQPIIFDKKILLYNLTVSLSSSFHS